LDAFRSNLPHDLDAATALANGAGLDEFAAVDLLGSLVAESLVERKEASGTTRYRLLEMIRQYAAEHLDAAGDAAGARDDHARYHHARYGTVALAHRRAGR
jgi:predicted ATPase